MCFGGGGGRMSTPQREYQNRPVTVTGSQTGVDDPKDTKKATETLKIQRQKKEGTYVDPNLTTAELLGTKKSGRSNNTKKKNLTRARINRNKKSMSDGRRVSRRV